jgi:hypothetical protein
MALLIWGVWSDRLLNQKETQEQLMDGMINKRKSQRIVQKIILGQNKPNQN